eukprot:363911-Chlamydomonas_euryale.AAC.4
MSDATNATAAAPPPAAPPAAMKSVKVQVHKNTLSCGLRFMARAMLALAMMCRSKRRPTCCKAQHRLMTRPACSKRRKIRAS